MREETGEARERRGERARALENETALLVSRVVKHADVVCAVSGSSLHTGSWCVDRRERNLKSPVRGRLQRGASHVYTSHDDTYEMKEVLY